jgi:uncharacterized protein YutE (UPF0331/DUF86 family)
MTPSQLRSKVITARIAWIEKMLENMKLLPIQSYKKFQSDPRNVAAAESYLRRALESLLDLGRHILAKGFGQAVIEYKEIALALSDKGVLTVKERELFREMAGYRNRMVHFYDEISERELYEICCQGTKDIEKLLDAMIKWIKDHPEMIDRSL